MFCDNSRKICELHILFLVKNKFKIGYVIPLLKLDEDFMFDKIHSEVWNLLSEKVSENEVVIRTYNFYASGIGIERTFLISRDANHNSLSGEPVLSLKRLRAFMEDVRKFGHVLETHRMTKALFLKYSAWSEHSLAHLMRLSDDEQSPAAGNVNVAVDKQGTSPIKISAKKHLGIVSDPDKAQVVADVKRRFDIVFDISFEDALFLYDANNQVIRRDGFCSLNPEYLLVLHKWSGKTIESYCQNFYSFYFNNRVHAIAVDLKVHDVFSKRSETFQLAILKIANFSIMSHDNELKCVYCLLSGVHQSVYCPIYYTALLRNMCMRARGICTGCHQYDCIYGRNVHPGPGIFCILCGESNHIANACTDIHQWKTFNYHITRVHFVIASTLAWREEEVERLNAAWDAIEREFCDLYYSQH